MRIALMTDLHANREAVEACLAHAQARGADQYAFTGDLVGYGADPGWVVDTVMDYVSRGAIVVQGNHDYFATQPVRPQMNPEAREALEWTRDHLTPEHCAFLAGLPLVAELDKLLFVHASAHEPEKWEYVKGVEQAERSLRATSARVVFSGHVHAPALYRRADDGRMGKHVPSSSEPIVLRPQHQHLVLPGSAGQPRDGNCASCYALYDDETREVCYFRVPYDHGAAARRVISEGLPLVFAMRLIEGL